MTTVDVTTSPSQNSRLGRFARAVARRWPSLAGIAVVVITGVGLGNVSDAAPVITASAFVYLGAAALGLRWAAWPVFGVSFVLIGIGLRITAFDPTWVMIGIAVVLLGYGLLRGRGKPAFGLPLQVAAMLVLAPLTLLAVRIDPTVAGVLIAAALLAHAGWDLYHHRKDRVVSRSLAEFCLVLDTVLAVLVLWLTFA